MQVIRVSPMSVLMLVSSILLVADSGWASGGYGGGARGGGYTSRADPVYERGKALFHGRVREHRGLEVCVVPRSGGDGARPEKAGRASLRPYKRRTVSELVERLVLCDAPQKLVGRHLGAKDFRALVYYLNKRYSLRLES